MRNIDLAIGLTYGLGVPTYTAIEPEKVLVRVQQWLDGN